MISRIQKIALVTGAAQGLGFSLTKELLDQKYVVIALVRSLEAEEKLLSCNNTDLLPIRADMRDLSFPDVVHEFIKQNTEHLDLIINNAGFGATTLDLRSIRFDEFRSVLDIHCTAPLRLLARIVPFLEAAPAESLIINISSRFASIQNVVSGTVPNEI
jgi:short-subunit dehydrogenase